MDESLYRGFDDRAHLFFEAIMKRVDHRKPDRKVLSAIFCTEIERCLPLSRRDSGRLEKAFNFTYRAHLHTPLRESGEAYIFHLVRSSLVIAWAQSLCRVYDLNTLIDDLLHDCVEESKSEYHSSLHGFSKLLTRSRVSLHFGWDTAKDVYTLTKHKEHGETSEAYCARLAISEEWRPLVVKIGGDRTDNMWTIGSVTPAQREGKIKETEIWFPQMISRLEILIDQEILHKRLTPAYNWRQFLTFITEYLWYAVADKKREFNLT